MKAKIEKVNIGIYDYDSIITTINGTRTEIVFNKKDNVKQYEEKTVELVNTDGKYTIKPIKETVKTEK